MNINIVAVGGIKEKFYRDAIDEYAKRLSRYVKLNIIEVKDEKTPADAKRMENYDILSKGNLTFVIGGSLGLHADVLYRADECLSFSDMTFPHQLMRVILLEQIYRAYRIRNNEPYHK